MITLSEQWKETADAAEVRRWWDSTRVPLGTKPIVILARIHEKDIGDIITDEVVALPNLLDRY